MDFEPKKYLFCIDSDGTVMDTMTVKHECCFGPCLFDAFPLPLERKEEILREWNDVNLYRSTRGINRFLGLANILRFACERYGLEIEGLEEFESYVEKAPVLSKDAIASASKEAKHQDIFLRACIWSDLVNASIRLLPKSHAFEECKKSLERLSDFADLIGVSSANASAVNAEWEEEGIAPLFRSIYCQDAGSKAEIIAKALKLGYEKENVIMLGDALGDYEAALKNGVHFYPLIPTKENASWKELRDLLAPKIEAGEYRGELEEKYVSSFHEFLANGR